MKQPAFMFKEDYEKLQASLRSKQPVKRKAYFVKPAKSLKNFDGLYLDKYTRHYINDQPYTTDEIIKMARDYAYRHSMGACARSRWLEDIANNLKRSGYVRTDLNRQTFAFGKLYKSIYEIAGKDATGIYGSYDELKTNEDYENCQQVNNVLCVKITNRIESVLGKKPANILKLRFGIDQLRPWTYAEIGKFYGVTGQTPRSITINSLQTLADVELPSLI